ncbi:MAG: hypothetical protein QOI29_3495, partial [Mycobacterium sp.]|nr:hypothetical protein [Mycobacterium sp.]
MTSDLRQLLNETALEGDTIPLSVDDMIRVGGRRRRGQRMLGTGAVASVLAL